MRIRTGLKGRLKHWKISNQWLQLPLDEYCRPGSPAPAISIVLLTIQIPVKCFPLASPVAHVHPLML